MLFDRRSGASTNDTNSSSNNFNNLDDGEDTLSSIVNKFFIYSSSSTGAGQPIPGDGLQQS